MTDRQTSPPSERPEERPEEAPQFHDIPAEEELQQVLEEHKKWVEEEKQRILEEHNKWVEEEKQGKKKGKTNWEIVISAIGVLVASIAVLVAIFQAKETIRLTQLSLSPYLNLEYHFSGEGPIIGIVATNKGLGPAEIKEFQLYLDNKAIVSSENGGWSTIMERVQSQLNLGVNTSSYTKGDIIRQGEQDLLFGVRTSTIRSEAEKEQVKNTLERVGIFICYCSMAEKERCKQEYTPNLSKNVFPACSVK